ncbi:lipopolysaccharide biosynthesis protein [Neolewinella antarctica]|uniref:O-antigen/teichoic acid export membrane protein n=1 Tax=Neolewinella antarctica TaxID=442734 RepID=A0ABX0XB49_9BACT|nr:polysaccharide biosynthesis C-terminal domain-containing protein [Neolewinella antarctica]NJC26158.1 O-antigen/teichoic acid export membrane protein [Neolewinella antarctica]
MGIIKRQAIKNNLISYLAVAVGAIAQLVLYPEDLELKGYADAVIKWVFLLGIFGSFGVQIVIVRFLPYLKGDRRTAAQQLVNRALVLVSLNVATLSLANLLYGQAAAEYLIGQGYDIGLLATDRWKIISLLASLVYSMVLTAHLSNNHRIAIPALFNSLLPKFLLPVLFGLAIYGYLSTNGFIWSFVGMYWLATLSLVVYAIVLGVFRPVWGRLKFKQQGVRDMVSLSAYSIFGGIGSALATHLDVVMINTYIGNYDTAVYTFAIFVVGVMMIPYAAINTISAPLVAKAWEQRDTEQLRFLYKETATVLFLAGGVIYSGAVVCLPAVYELTGKTSQLALGYTAAILLGGGQLFDQLTSINSLLITFTDSYRWGVVFSLVLGGVNLVLNYVFIVTLGMGITGAALATMLSLIMYNVVKMIFVYSRLGIHPLSRSVGYTALVILVVCGLGVWIPRTEFAWLDVVIRGGFVSLSFLAYLNFTNGVPAFRAVLKGGIKNLFR